MAAARRARSHLSGEADRGELRAQYEQAETSPATGPPLPARRRPFSRLFAPAEAPPVVETAPSVPATWAWPSAGEEFRGELHQPQQWNWPSDALPETAGESPQVEHYGAAWDAPALTAPEAPMIGWAEPMAVWSDPGPSYEVLAAPSPETALSSQAEIDTFIDAAWETAPAIEIDPHYDVPTLPTPNVEPDAGNKCYFACTGSLLRIREL
jgi:hypothetical protein